MKMNQKTKKLWHLVMLLTVDLALLILIASVCASKAQAMCLGCSGERVAAIQQRLAEMGVYSGLPTGEYNLETRRAIKKIQHENGLAASGETDFETLAAMGINSRTALCFTAEAELLARCIQLSNCQSYPEMLEKGIEILKETESPNTLGKYIAQNFPDFLFHTNEPTSQAYSAALQAIRSFL